jgi:zinc protease
MSKSSIVILILTSLIIGCHSEATKESDVSQQPLVNTSLKGDNNPKPEKTNGAMTFDLNIEYQSMQLKNGLTAIFHIDRSDPVVAVALTAHVGSAREKPGRTGFAHLFEHLLFLESENLGKGGLDKMSARIGGSGANGSTSRDSTNYFQTVPRNALEKMLWAEADKLGYFINTVTEPVLAKEKQVVKNEKRQSVDNRPYGHTQYVIDKNLYPKGHPYSWQVIGSLEDLQNATLQDVKDFFNQWYVPNNVNLVIAGDFDIEQAKTWIHKYFDEIPAGKPVDRNKKRPAVLTSTIKKYYEDNYAKLPELTITWPTVPRYHSDYYALAVLRQLLSDGKKAPLNQVLIDELKLTNRVEMFGYASELAGQTSLRVRAFQDKSLNEVFNAVGKALQRFENVLFSNSDLERIKSQQETAFYRDLSSALGKGFQLAQYQIYQNDPGFINQDVKNILAVTKQNVINAYQTYIKDQHFVATSFVPKGKVNLALTDSSAAQVLEEKIVAGAEESFGASINAEFTRTPSSFDRTLEPEYDEKPIEIEMPKVNQQVLDNQLKVLSINHTEVPLVNFDLRIAGGMLFEQFDKLGASNLMARLMNRGTKNKTPQQLEEALKQIGASVNIFADKQGINISGDSLSKNYSAMMAIVSEMILQPRWDEIELALLKESITAEIKQQLASPNAVASNQFDKLIFGESNILSNNRLGTEKSLSNLTMKDLKSYYANYFSPHLASMHVVGDISQADISDSLAQLADQWKPNLASLPTIKTLPKLNKAKLFFYDIANAKQSVLRIGNPSIKATHKDYYLAQVANYRLGGGGFASILTQQLRESKGYTYVIRSGFSGTRNTGRFAIQSGVRANVTFESLALIREILSSYQQSLNAKDLQLTKGFFLKSNARRFETPSAKLNILSNISANSLPIDYIQSRTRQLSHLDLEQIKAIVGEYIQPDKMIYLVVGDAKTQLKSLQALGLGKPILLNP